ncbi:hypothetical protein F5Y16DRAFT_365281 [Xylariaceae sp. FL0255]|nr:hypothetical protein F5Y16DRAFT_365281 [Xylariaceae sp. FL0255]
MNTPTENGASAPVLSGLFRLPTELIDSIFSHCSPFDLTSLSHVCRRLRSHSLADLHWQRLVLSQIPGNRVSTPYPHQTWRELYWAHDPFWFLTRHKLWFCDRSLAGQLVIARYDEHRGCIEGYQLLALNQRQDSEHWVADPTVSIHHFQPRLRLHLDKPAFQLDSPRQNSFRTPNASSKAEVSLPRPFVSEKMMPNNYVSHRRFRKMCLAKALDPEQLLQVMNEHFPYGSVWPPPSVPTHHRVRGHPDHDIKTPTDWKPSNRAEASDQTFRIHQWRDLGPSPLRIHIDEEYATYSTLHSALYTPTQEKPWRGIWVGDYSVHSCEFILIHQPGGTSEHQEEPLLRFDNEDEEDYQKRFLKERVYRGPLQAIKLTGDPNVPRGELTFKVDDLGEEGFVGDLEGHPFQGARAVKSRGHIAAHGFQRDRFIESQLILISHNRLAQYWVEFGHISFFERVDIDKFLVPDEA